MAAKSVLSIQIVPYIPILRVCEPIATTLRVVVTYMDNMRFKTIGCQKHNSTPEGRAAARPKDGLFRLHASWIYLSYAGFDCLAAILCH